MQFTAKYAAGRMTLAKRYYYLFIYCFAGEASPSNLHLNNHWRHLPGNENLTEPRYVILDYIHHFLPKAKIIILFRDPIDRYLITTIYSRRCSISLFFIIRAPPNEV